MRRIVLLLIAFFLAAPAVFAQGDEPGRRVEVVEVQGIIDGPLEGAVLDGLRAAEEHDAEALILQIDSPGALGADRSRRLVEAVVGAEVPVVTWIGPPGARAENSAAAILLAGHVTAMAPGTALGPARTADLRASGEQPELIAELLRDTAAARDLDRGQVFGVYSGARSADEAEEGGLADVLAIQLPDLLRELDGTTLEVASGEVTLRTDPSELSVRFRKADLLGRVLHAVGQPSIAYLLLLLGLVGVVFEIFHPSTGPAGVTGLLGLGLAFYAVATLGGSWIGVALIVLGVAGFCVDLRFQGLGVFTAVGFAGLVAGSLLLFSGAWLHTDPWVLLVGVAGMVGFLLGAMTRVLRDLRLIARGELEVRDPHPE